MLHTEAKEVLRVTANEYLDHVTEQYCFEITAIGRVRETGRQFVVRDDYRLRRPDITIEVSSL